MGYYDIDDAIADGERVPCKFNITVPGLGYLEGNPGKPLAKGTKLELPAWLAVVLATSELFLESDASFLNLEEPDFISSKVLNAIKADPRSVDLHSIMSNYYTLIEKWAGIYSDAALAEIAMAMLKERALEIDNYASNTSKHVNSPFLYSLDEFEKRLYRATYESKKQMREWINNI